MGACGVEPQTSALSEQCSNQLSYAPIYNIKSFTRRSLFIQQNTPSACRGGARDENSGPKRGKGYKQTFPTAKREKYQALQARDNLYFTHFLQKIKKN